MSSRRKPAPTDAKPKRSARSVIAGLRRPSRRVPELKATKKIRNGTRGQFRKWDHDKTFAYVIGELRDGRLLVDICRVIGLRMRDFYDVLNSIDPTDPDPDHAKARQAEKRLQYERARKDQAKAISLEVQLIADGRDRISRRRRKQAEKLKKQLLKQKNPAANAILESFERTTIARNRLQLDARKWYARVLDPENFSDRPNTLISATTDGENGVSGVSIRVEFIKPDAIPEPLDLPEATHDSD